MSRAVELDPAYPAARASIQHDAASPRSSLQAQLHQHPIASTPFSTVLLPFSHSWHMEMKCQSGATGRPNSTPQAIHDRDMAYKGSTNPKLKPLRGDIIWLV